MAIRPSWSERVRAVRDAAVDEYGGKPHPTGSLVADGVSLITSDQVLLLDQATAGLNGPWIYMGTDQDMVRPDDFSSSSQPTSAYTVTVGSEGTTYANSRWRTRWIDGYNTVDTHDPKFVREDPVIVNAALFDSLPAAFSRLPDEGGTVLIPSKPDPYESGTITCDKPVQVLLDGATITATASPLFDIQHNFQIRGIGRATSTIKPLSEGKIFNISDVPAWTPAEGKYLFACENLTLGDLDYPGSMAFDTSSLNAGDFREGHIRFENNLINGFTGTAIQLQESTYFSHISRNRFFCNYQSINLGPACDGYIRHNEFRGPVDGAYQIFCKSTDVHIEENAFYQLTINDNEYADILICPTVNSDGGTMIWIARNKFGSEGESRNHNRSRILCLAPYAGWGSYVSRSVWITKNWFAIGSKSISATTIERASGEVTVETEEDHYLQTGAKVTIADVSEHPSFHGTYEITREDANTFTYLQSGDNEGPVTGTGTIWLANTCAIRIMNPIDRWVISENRFQNYGILVDDVQDLESSGSLRTGQSVFIDNSAYIGNPINGYKTFENGGRQFGKVRSPFNAPCGDWGGDLPKREAPELRNRLRYSEDFSQNPPWTQYIEEGYPITFTDGQEDPFGTNRAQLVECPGQAASECFRQAWEQGEEGEDGRVYVSFWAKEGSLSSMTVGIYNSSTKVIESDAIALGSTWKRYLLSAELEGGSWYALHFYPGHEAHALAGSLYLFGAQVADFDSDYMPTTSTVVEDTDTGTRFDKQVGFTAIKAIARNGTPTIITWDGLGSDASVGIHATSSDMAGLVTITVGTGPGTSGYVIVDFAKPYATGTQPRVFGMFADGTGNWAGASLRVQSMTASTFRLGWTGATISYNQTLYLEYFVVEV